MLTSTKHYRLPLKFYTDMEGTEANGFLNRLRLQLQTIDKTRDYLIDDQKSIEEAIKLS